MRDHAQQPYRNQQRVGDVIRAFATQRELPADDAFAVFGAVNFSFCHSGTVAPATCYLETAECRPVLLEELSLPKLNALFFTGRDCLELFYLTLWKVGTDVREVDTAGCGLQEADPNGSAVETTLATGSQVTCIFTQHFSPRGRPLASASPQNSARPFLA